MCGGDRGAFLGTVAGSRRRLGAEIERRHHTALAGPGTTGSRHVDAGAVVRVGRAKAVTPRRSDGDDVLAVGWRVLGDIVVGVASRSHEHSATLNRAVNRVLQCHGTRCLHRERHVDDVDRGGVVRHAIDMAARRPCNRGGDVAHEAPAPGECANGLDPGTRDDARDALGVVRRRCDQSGDVRAVPRGCPGGSHATPVAWIGRVGIPAGLLVGVEWDVGAALGARSCETGRIRDEVIARHHLRVEVRVRGDARVDHRHPSTGTRVDRVEPGHGELAVTEAHAVGVPQVPLRRRVLLVRRRWERAAGRGRGLIDRGGEHELVRLSPRHVRIRGEFLGDLLGVTERDRLAQFDDMHAISDLVVDRQVDLRDRLLPRDVSLVVNDPDSWLEGHDESGDLAFHAVRRGGLHRLRGC